MRKITLTNRLLRDVQLQADRRNETAEAYLSRLLKEPVRICPPGFIPAKPRTMFYGHVSRKPAYGAS